jgi:hypothetical protein
VDPIGEAEQQMALEALKMVYVDEATSEEVRRELNNVVSLIWKLSEEIDIEQSPNQVANLGQLLRYCLNPATHTAATTQADRHLLAELGLTLFARIMHEIVRAPSPAPLPASARLTLTLHMAGGACRAASAVPPFARRRRRR